MSFAAAESSIAASTPKSLEDLASRFFQRSDGNWRSQRRYYTLKTNETQAVVSDLSIRFLEAGTPELSRLAELHGLTQTLICGAQVSWESRYLNPQHSQTSGSTIFGLRGDLLYRDRGFATTKPVIARFCFLDPQTMHLYAEYKGSAFEEELKLVGDRYRTRQTIISRAGEEMMIGQYLEKRQ